MKNEIIKEYEKCNICPRECGINRYKQKGYCKMPAQLYLSKAYLHMWEEPSISGEKGSGTVFFSGCNLKCILCQNYKIALGDYGKEVDSEELANIYLKLQEKGANNINLVTPSHYIINIAKSLKIAKKRGLKIPVVYNTSSYDKVESLKILEGLVDIYLADFKYMESDIAYKYSKAENYSKIAKKAIKEMYRQTGENVFGEDGLMRKGVIIRHLVLPGHKEDSKKIIKFLYSEYGDKVYLSIMNQYTAVRNLPYENLNRKVEDKEYEEIIDYAIKIGVENAYIQEGGTVSESFIPDFDLEGI